MYSSFISKELHARLLADSQDVPGVSGMRYHGGAPTGLETQEALAFVAELCRLTRPQLAAVLKRRAADRVFIDSHTRVCVDFNQRMGVDFTSDRYRTVLGLQDAEGRVVVGPTNENYVKCAGKPIAPLPDYLKGPHVTLFGPPDSAKMAINAVNCFHRQLPGEPAIVSELVGRAAFNPMWGADDEDSKTPLHAGLIGAAVNLKKCYEGTLTETDAVTGKHYAIVKERRALPIKRIPGLALPCTFLFVDGEAVPLHLYDFAIHFFHCWDRPTSLTFYIPKLENEEEAAYVRELLSIAESLLQRRHAEYAGGAIRVILVIENPRAIFRVHEIMDALHPYFAGASLGWHDYLASAARLFREDPNFRIPVKADPDIVVKYILASHRLLADVVGPRGGIKIGGMYGVLPVGTDLNSASFQVTLRGYFRDVCTQLKRRLDGFWVAHPDFVRIGIAIVEAWRLRETGAGDKAPLEQLIRALISDPAEQDALIAFIDGPDIESLDVDSPMYARSLIVADVKSSVYIANNDPEEVRYNVFQTLQYLADWLAGNGCVALPATIGGQPVRIMDDLATCERSRWEIWAEIRHGRFSVEDFLRIANEEMHFIRKDLSDSKKIVQVKFGARTEKWYPVAFNLLVRVCLDPHPVEFFTELLLAFTIPSVREAADPWEAAARIDPVKFSSRFRSGL